MDDLVKRLRRMDGDSMSIKTLDEAADRIEALEARIAAADALAECLRWIEAHRGECFIPSHDGLWDDDMSVTLAAYEATKGPSK